MSKTSEKKPMPSLSLATRLRYWPAGIQVALMRLLALLPLPFLRALGAGLGTLLWPLAGERRLITLRNLELCFPEKNERERLQLAKQNFHATATGFLETAKVWYTPPTQIAKWIEIEGQEHLQAAFVQGKGVLLLAFHLTDLELGAVAVAQFGKVAGMYRPHADPVFDEAMRRGRERHLPMIPRDDVRGMLRWLKSGGAVWYAADQDYGAQHSVFAPFFGIPTATITATSRFAKLSGAPVVPLTHVRTRRGIRLVIHAPLTAIPSGDERTDAATMNRFLAAWLSEHPADYLWLHRRFKTRPAGAAPLYPKRHRRHHPDEISGKRLDTWLRVGRADSFDESGRPLRVHLADLAIDLLPERGALLALVGGDAEARRLAILELWQQRGIAVAKPQRLCCPARHLIVHRYERVESPESDQNLTLSLALFGLHQGGANVAATELFLAGKNDAIGIVLPATVAPPLPESVASALRPPLLAGLTASQIEHYRHLAAGVESGSQK